MSYLYIHQANIWVTSLRNTCMLSNAFMYRSALALSYVTALWKTFFLTNKYWYWFFLKSNRLPFFFWRQEMFHKSLIKTTCTTGTILCFTSSQDQYGIKEIAVIYNHCSSVIAVSFINFVTMAHYNQNNTESKLIQGIVVKNISHWCVNLHLWLTRKCE